MRSKLKKKWDDFQLKAGAIYMARKARKKAKTRLKRMNGGFNCDKEYKESVVPYWKKYGYKPAKFWYKMFSDRDKKVDPRYIPDDLFYSKMLPYFNNARFRQDKCYHDVWCWDVKRPRTICKNIAGVFFDGERHPITAENALALCLATEGEFLVKPSIDTGEGKMIRFFDSKTATKEDIEKAFREMGANFIFQESVKQHPAYARVNASSLNTVRVLSFFFKGEVYILSCNFRIGAPDSKVDNVGAGGFACQVFENGQLCYRAVNRKAQWVEECHNGIRFADVTLPYFDRIIETVKRKHPLFAHFKMIGWDFAMDEEGDPVLIEYNVCPGTNQITCGPTFGDLTEEVLDDFFIHRTLEHAQN